MTAVADQKLMSMRITRLDGEGAVARRLRIHAAFKALRNMANSVGGRLTEGRRHRGPDGSTFVDFIVVKRRR